MSFTTLGLSAELLRAIADQGYSKPTPVQRQAIPVILEGKDILAGAQTGTGKTAGFALPLLQLLNKRSCIKGKNSVRALILTPTRELAAQVEESVAAYGKYLPLKSAVIFGGRQDQSADRPNSAEASIFWWQPPGVCSTMCNSGHWTSRRSRY